jgi:hypothetical protein
MTLRMKLTAEDRYVTFVSAYAPTMTYDDATKERFYEDLDRVILSVPAYDKLLLLGDFNARVGREVQHWSPAIGHHGVGKENSNGTLLLSTCMRHNLVITNTLYQQADKYKTTWMHPRSRHWHLIDYVITRLGDRADVNITRAMRGTGLWSDHRLLRAKVNLNLKPKLRRTGAVVRKCFNVQALKSAAIVANFRKRVSTELSQMPADDVDVERSWSAIKTALYVSAGTELRPPKRKHQDWFDDNDASVSGLLQSLHSSHATWLADRTSMAKKEEYLKCKRTAQASLRRMKDAWWSTKALELQAAADQHDSKKFYGELRAIYGPKCSGSCPILSADGSTKLVEANKILSRWAEHFNSVLNCPSTVSSTALSEIIQLDLVPELDLPPSTAEVKYAISQLAPGKAAGPDGIPSEIYQFGGVQLTTAITDLFRNIWVAESVPKDFRDATIVHLYKRKGNRAACDNHRGISLLATAGKLLSRVMLNRITSRIAPLVLPESQCGFRSGRGTVDMIFTARQLQEKCREQRQDLYIVFFDLTKAFDSVNRPALWCILRKLGCPEKFVNIIRSFHDGMSARVLDQGSFSEPFTVTNGVRQGCVLAPTLFSLLLAVMLQDAFRHSSSGVYMRFRTDGRLFNLRRLQARTKVLDALIRDLLFADDCALVAHTLADVQLLSDCFSQAAKRFGLTVSIKKTEVLHQPKPGCTSQPPVVHVDGVALNVVDRFCYLGSVISNDASIDNDVTKRLAAANGAFGALEKRLWSEHGVRLETKIAVYKAVVLTTLLYGCEAWTTYRCHIRKLDMFHLRCLRRILRVTWLDKVPNTEVLARCHIGGMESLIMRAQLRWTGHVVRMADDRIPKMVLYGELKQGTRTCGGQYKRFRDVVKHNLQACNIDTTVWESAALDRTVWRQLCTTGVNQFETARISSLQEKRQKRKTKAAAPSSAAPSTFYCAICCQDCSSRIGLFSHSRTHR